MIGTANLMKKEGLYLTVKQKNSVSNSGGIAIFAYNSINKKTYKTGKRCIKWYIFLNN